MAFQNLDRDGVTALVYTFYNKVRNDPELGPVFLGKLGEDWEPHLQRMVRFWSTVALGTREFDGNVFGTHMAISGVEPEHFKRWLAMFEETARELFAPEQAEEFLTPARRIAGSLQYGYFGKIEYM